MVHFEFLSLLQVLFSHLGLFEKLIHSLFQLGRWLGKICQPTTRMRCRGANNGPTLNFAVSSRLDTFPTGSACNGKERCSALSQDISKDRMKRYEHNLFDLLHCLVPFVDLCFCLLICRFSV